jgi:hypothetical protein
MGPPKFSTLLFLHARRLDPDRPSGISPCRHLRSMFVFSVGCLVSRQCHAISTIVSPNDSSVLASSMITLSPSAFSALTRLKSLQGGANTPLAYKMLCVRFTYVVHERSSVRTSTSLSFIGANTRYGWVVSPYPTGTFTRQEAPSCAWRTITCPSLGLTGKARLCSPRSSSSTSSSPSSHPRADTAILGCSPRTARGAPPSPRWPASPIVRPRAKTPRRRPPRPMLLRPRARPPATCGPPSSPGSTRPGLSSATPVARNCGRSRSSPSASPSTAS